MVALMLFCIISGRRFLEERRSPPDTIETLLGVYTLDGLGRLGSALLCSGFGGKE